VAFVQDPADRAVAVRRAARNGHIRVVRGTTVLGPDFLDLSAAIVSGGEQGLLGLAFFTGTRWPAGPLVHRLHQPPPGDTVVARLPPRRPMAVTTDASTRFDPALGRAPAARRSSPSRFANHKRRAPRVRTRRDAVHRSRRRRIRRRSRFIARREPAWRLLGKMLRIDQSTCLIRIPPAIRFRRAIRLPAGAPGGRAAGDLGVSACAIRGGTPSTIPARGGHRRARDRRCRPEPLRRDRLTSRPTAAAANYGWRKSRGAARQRDVASAGISGRWSIRFTSTTMRRDSRSPAASSIGERRCRRFYRGRYFFADYVQGPRLVAGRSRLTARRGRGIPRMSWSTPRSLRASAPFGLVSSFRRRRRRRAVHRQLHTRPRLQDHRPSIRRPPCPGKSTDRQIERRERKRPRQCVHRVEQRVDAERISGAGEGPRSIRGCRLRASKRVAEGRWFVGHDPRGCGPPRDRRRRVRAAVRAVLAALRGAAASAVPEVDGRKSAGSP